MSTAASVEERTSEVYKLRAANGEAGHAAQRHGHEEHSLAGVLGYVRWAGRIGRETSAFPTPWWVDPARCLVDLDAFVREVGGVEFIPASPLPFACAT